MKSKKIHTLILWSDVGLKIKDTTDAKLNLPPHDEHLEISITTFNTQIAKWLLESKLHAYSQSGDLLEGPKTLSELQHIYVNLEAVNNALEKKGHLENLMIVVTKDDNKEEQPWITMAKEIGNDFYLKVALEGNPPTKKRVVEEVVKRLNRMNLKTKNGRNITYANAFKQAFSDWEAPESP
jgi:CDP-diacylglycerol pyrophosphatase